jgi:cell division protein FtsB
LCLYFLYSIISIQIDIYKQKQTLEEFQRQVYEQKLKNDELERQLGDGEADMIERIAREKLDFIAPDERVIIAQPG